MFCFLPENCTKIKYAMDLKKKITRVLGGFLLMGFVLFFMTEKVNAREIYQLKIYSIETSEQEARMDQYLKNAYIPALHRAGISKVGVFKPIGDDEMAGKLIYVLIPFKSVDQFEQLGMMLKFDKKYQEEGKDYILAAHDNAPYERIQSVLLRSFKSMPDFGIPEHSTPKSERIYELRSYQGATERLYEKKVEMFNEGKEAKLFMDLGFQPIFFGEVISGPIMPNLMYFITFENKASQDAHWKSFVDSPEWGKLKGDPKYANTVSKIDKYLLYPAEYSEL